MLVYGLLLIFGSFDLSFSSVVQRVVLCLLMSPSVWVPLFVTCLYFVAGLSPAARQSGLSSGVHRSWGYLVGFILLLYLVYPTIMLAWVVPCNPFCICGLYLEALLVCTSPASHSFTLCLRFRGCEILMV